MALLLREALDAGAPPSMARLPMTAEEVAASYDALDADAEDGASTLAMPGAALGRVRVPVLVVPEVLAHPQPARPGSRRR